GRRGRRAAVFGLCRERGTPVGVIRSAVGVSVRGQRTAVARRCRGFRAGVLRVRLSVPVCVWWWRWRPHGHRRCCCCPGCGSVRVVAGVVEVGAEPIDDRLIWLKLREKTERASVRKAKIEISRVYPRLLVTEVLGAVGAIWLVLGPY